MVERSERGMEESVAPLHGDILNREDFDGVIFDLDGVITDTATTHFRAWKDTFDPFLRSVQGRGGALFSEDDYRRYVDGKPRLDGIRSFLASRGLDLREGGRRRAIDREHNYGRGESIASLARKKNENYHRRLESGEIKVFEPAVELLHQLLRKGMRIGLVSSSQNAERVLQVLKLDTLFDVRVDGQTLEEAGLSGKPAADMYIEAASRLGIEPERAVVVEDAESGVQAARAGGFGLVIGVASDREREDRLLEEGADMVIESLDQLITRH